MTKKELAIIQQKETKLWYELALYDNANAPTDGDYTREIEWDTNDTGHRVRLSEWYAVSTLMDALGIESLYNEEASKLRSDLFKRRQASRGIFYDGRGNEIKTEEPTEKEPEEETPEELPEEDEAPTEDEEVEEYDDENDPYEFYDNETGEVLTRGQLYRDYSRQKHKYPMEFEGISFGQYINNCLTRNGGTLERI